MTLEQARTETAVYMAEARRDGIPSLAKPKSKDTTLGAFLTDDYGPWARINLKWGAGALDRIETGFDGLLSRKLSDVNPWVIERWWRRRLARESTKTKAPVSKATAARELAALRSALSKAVEWGVLPEHPLARTKPPRSHPNAVVRYLDANEESRLRDALAKRDSEAARRRESANRWRSERKQATLPQIPVGGFADHLTPLVLVAMNTGLRRGELTSLVWSSVDLTAKLLTVRAAHAKSGKTRHIPLNNEAASVLTRWRDQRGTEGRVFPVADVKTSWTALTKVASVTSFRFHDLRHHFASKLVMAGIDLNTVRELLGHADIKMTLRYAHLAPEHLAKAVAALDAA